MAITIGIDPGFANVGVAVVDATNEGLQVRRLHVISTEKDKNYKYIADDNLRRAQYLYDILHDFVIDFEPMSLCVERMSYPRNAATAAKTAMFWGILAAVAFEECIPIVSVGSQDVKKHICGDRKASKNDIIKVLNDRFKPNINGIKKSKLEHCFDALANVVTVIENEKLDVAICY